MATPHVSGVAMVLWNKYPASTNTDIRAALEAGATDVGSPGLDDEYGHGIVNYWAAMFTAIVKTDQWPTETRYTVTRSTTDGDEVVVQKGPFSLQNTRYSWEECIDQDACTFTIYDSYGDGLEAGGYYSVLIDGVEVGSGGSFNQEDIIHLCRGGGGLCPEPWFTASCSLSILTIALIGCAGVVALLCTAGLVWMACKAAASAPEPPVKGGTRNSAAVARASAASGVRGSAAGGPLGHHAAAGSAVRPSAASSRASAKVYPNPG
ncbi:hypothetical protein EMIHUDRAFT_194768 [Emiliania huxleyi CCMP1516]|uniref:Peptidase S8/S53 domain-containing protein n=2 Tax=Emiliania huxleyi TaxID=2903 RepID=A0A0D3L233_EMIH1|nr:hypothetical protein EMIHUDRAFT_194768 [Emiliania huxleyi CCMP1516]EOD42068.1 hypothetical protein EMIHUDRAFT_194768 [Emiliania huxleyi CCMP1516]|eukprot:XP_005794497.1 hypothetical protein EMIHUDRAFT_194768 [Emiliania huxleyi CCMP1516]